MRLQPSELDKMEFYMIEYLLKDLDEKITEENKAHKKQEGEYKKQTTGIKNPQMPKVGSTNFGGFKTPKIPTPKIPRM
jgi:hypothetical protein